MMCHVTERFTISLPDELAGDVRRRARKAKRPVSHVIADALRAQETADLRERMREGYRTVADESRAFSEAALPIAMETWPED